MSEVTDKIDRFGHCVNCGKNLLTKKVIDGKVVDIFLPIYNETLFLLNNGSQMQVTICTPCKNTIDLNDSNKHLEIMEAVQKGWELESELLVRDENVPQATKEWKKEYLDKQSELSIDCHSELMSKFSIQNRSLELRKVEILEVNKDVNN